MHHTLNIYNPNWFSSAHVRIYLVERVKEHHGYLISNYLRCMGFHVVRGPFFDNVRGYTLSGYVGG